VTVGEQEYLQRVSASADSSRLVAKSRGNRRVEDLTQDEGRHVRGGEHEREDGSAQTFAVQDAAPTLVGLKVPKHDQPGQGSATQEFR
jgi:hypothetical protein